MSIFLVVLSALASFSLLINYRLLSIVLGGRKSNKLLITENEQLADYLLESFDNDGKPRHKWKKESESTQLLSRVSLQEDTLITEVCLNCRTVHRYWKSGIANHDQKYKDIEGFFIGGTRIDNNDQRTFCLITDKKLLLSRSQENDT